MMRWLLNRLRRGRPSTAPNRETRRQMNRITRLPRREVEQIAAAVRRVPVTQREALLDVLPEWQADEIRRWL